jgi:hypothetical protein
LFYFSKPVSLSKISILPASEKFFVKLKKWDVIIINLKTKELSFRDMKKIYRRREN